MTCQPQQPNSEPDALDRLLAEARWAEPTPESIARLRGQWHRLSVRRPRDRHRLAIVTAMVAAMLLVALGLTFFGSRDDVTILQASEGLALCPTPQAVQPKKPPVGQTVAKQQQPPPAVPRVAKTRSSRPPNAYELVARATYRRRCSSRQRGGTTDGPLAATASPQADRPERESAAQREFLASVLSRGDLQSVGQFLERVEDPRTTAIALQSLADVPNPPVETLFQCLRGSPVSRRMAAALVLGRLDQPAVSQALIAMVRRGVYRQEAMVALLSSSEITARQFLADAEQNPSLSASLWNAKRQFQTSIAWRS